MLRAQTLVTLKEYQCALFDVNRLIEINPSSDVYRNLQARLKTQLVCCLSLLHYSYYATISRRFTLHVTYLNLGNSVSHMYAPEGITMSVTLHCSKQPSGIAMVYLTYNFPVANAYIYILCIHLSIRFLM